MVVFNWCQFESMLWIQTKRDSITNVQSAVHWNKTPNQTSKQKMKLSLFYYSNRSAKTMQKNADDDLSDDKEWTVHGVQKTAVNRFPFDKRRCKRKRKINWDHSHWIRNELLMMQWWLWCSTFTVITWNCDRQCECMVFIPCRQWLTDS